MKFGQLMEYDIINIFLEKSFKESNGETIPTSFSKKTKLSISLDQSSKVLYSLVLYVKLSVVETKLQTSCIYLM